MVGGGFAAEARAVEEWVVDIAVTDSLDPLARGDGEVVSDEDEDDCAGNDAEDDGEVAGTPASGRVDELIERVLGAEIGVDMLVVRDVLLAARDVLVGAEGVPEVTEMVVDAVVVTAAGSGGSIPGGLPAPKDQPSTDPGAGL